MIDESVIQRIKDLANITDVVGGYIKIKKEGADFVGLCPFHNEKTPSFKLSPAKGIYKCFGCGKSGDSISFIMEHEHKTYLETLKLLAAKYNIEWEETGSIKKEFVKPVPRLQKVSDKVLQFFESRGISNNTLLRFQVTEASEWMPQFQKEVQVICFNYFRDDGLVNIKFRGQGKSFKMEKNAELIFYNIDAALNCEEIVIVEGEMDCLSLYEAGIFNAISVPNGAGTGNQKLEYLDNCWKYFEGKERVILMTDNDNPGKTLREELARRIGYERCYQVQYKEGCKDANDVLVKFGKESLMKAYQEATQWPLYGILTMFDLADKVISLYENGYPNGFVVPLPGMKEQVQLQLMLGQMTTVTGIPGSGKSEFIDWLMVEMSRAHGWKWGVLSAENQPSELHVSKLMEKFYGKSFAFRKDLNDRIPQQQIFNCIDFINEHFFFININEIEMTLDSILEKVRQLVLRKGIRGYLIDPWNFIEHKRENGQNETDYTNTALTKIGQFNKLNQTHSIMVAHPTKLKKEKDGKYEIPTMYSISGSAHWFNRTDNGISIYRDFNTNIVDVYIQKVRYSWLGNIGFISYNYNKVTRQYEYGNQSAMAMGLPENGSWKPINNFYEKDEPF